MSEIFDNKYMYLTDPNTARTDLVIFKTNPNNTIDKSTIESKLVFLPQKFETMNNQQIRQYQKYYTRQFLLWSFMNPSKIPVYLDKKIVLTKLLDFNMTIVCCLGISMLMRRSLNKVYLPFVQMFLEDYKITLKTINSVISMSFCLLACRQSYKGLLDQPYLYDIGLKYKEQVMPNVLYSPNCPLNII